MKLKYKNGGVVKLQNAGRRVPTPEEIEQVPTQISTTSVRTAPVEAQFKTVRRKPTESEKNAEEIARIVLEEAANKSTGRASGIGNRDLPLQNEYPELMLIPATAEIKAARNIGTGLLRTAAGTIVGDEMARGAANLGQKIDNVLSTRMFTPTFGFIGGLSGYALGSNMMGGMASGLRLPRKYRVEPINERTYFAEDQTPKYNPNQLTDNFGKVKYYGPTMGKTTAVASNSRLIDFDDIIRQPSRTILDRYGFKNKSEMYNSRNQEAIKAYEDMLVKTLQDGRANPENANLTLVASPTAIANSTKTGFYFDNIPSIPARDVFITRNVGRGGTPEASAMGYDNLMKKNPNLKIDNRFVSEIEKLPYQTPKMFQGLFPQSAFASLKDPEQYMRMRDNEHQPIDGIAEDISSYLKSKNKRNGFDTKYNGQYTVTPEEGFIRRNQGGEARVNYIKTHPIDNSKLNTTSYGETTIEEQMNLANRTFAKKYASQFPENFHKAIQYEAVSPPTYGYSEGTILGPFVDKFGIEPGQIKVGHAKDDAGPLARIVDSHEGHHVSGNMDDVYVLRRLIESGIVDEAKLTNYLKDADRGEPTAHISELLDGLGFTGYKDGYYTGHPYGKNSVSDIDIRRYNGFLHKNNFKHTFFDAIYKDKLQEFAKFVNEHPFALTLPITGLSLTATQLPQKEKQGGIIKGQNGFLNTWQKAYNSKFGKGLRDFMFGKDRDLSDEEYLEKYGYNKPVGGIGVLGALVAPEGEGLEIPEITAQHFGNQGKVLRWFESGNSKMLKVPVKETSKKTSNWQKFLKLSQQEQDDFVRRGNGESFQGFATLKGDKQALSKFRSGINSRK